MLSNRTLVSIALPSLETNINFAKENGVSSIKHVFTSAKAQKHKKRRGERICHFVLTKQNKKKGKKSTINGAITLRFVMEIKLWNC